MTPESIRWLAAKGKKEEAEAVLKKMADTNGKSLPLHTGELLENVRTWTCCSNIDRYDYYYNNNIYTSTVIDGS